MTADLKRISEYLDNLDNRVEQWVQETTAEAADKTLGYMDNQQYELNETIRELDEKISKTKGDTAKLILKQLKSRAKTHQQQIKDRVERINNYLSKLLKLQGKVCQLADKMKSIASVIKTSFPNDNPKVDETSGETLDKALKRKAEDLKKYWDYAPNDFSYAADNAEATFQNRNSITIRHVLGSTLDKILWLLRLFPKYENADLAKPLENKRDDVLSYLDELEGKTTPKTPEPAGTAGKIEPQGKEGQSKTNIQDYKALNPAKVPISRLIEQGESHTLEFKEIPECNTKQNRKNNDVLFPPLKTIAGFLNAEGGILLIGVDNSGKIVGIEPYLNTMGQGNNDTFEQQIRNCLRDRFEPYPIGKVKVSFEKFMKGTVCRIDVQADKEPVNLDNEIYVRDGNTTQLLKGRRLTDWIQQRRLLTELPSGK